MIQMRNKVSYNWYQNGPWETLSLRESLAIIWGMTSVSMEHLPHTHLTPICQVKHGLKCNEVNKTMEESTQYIQSTEEYLTFPAITCHKAGHFYS